MVSADFSQTSPYSDSLDTLPEARRGITLADMFVVCAMALVMMALAIGLVMQLGLPLETAVATTALVFAVLLAGHVGLRRSDNVSKARTDARTDAFEAFDSEATDAKVEEQRVAVEQASDGPLHPATNGVTEAKAGAEDGKAGDLGNFRPKKEPELGSATEQSAGTPKIDDLIKRLADDIEAGRNSDAEQSAGTVEPDLSATKVPPPPPVPSAAPAVEPEAASKKPPTMVEAAKEVSVASATSAHTVTPAAKLAAIADALSDEQMDVYLQTINGLDDSRAHHYEASIRLRLADGEMMDNDAFIEETRGTGLLPLLEAVKVSSTKRLAVQMVQRGRQGGFFTAIDGEALADKQFGDDVDTIVGSNKALAERLVLAFSQADVRNLTEAQQRTLQAIADMGFKFSIEEITDLDMDFEDLVSRGFMFAKLDAEVFLDGLVTGTTRVPPADICQHLAALGLTLIVGKIDDENARAKILGFGAVLGQGALFGSPRPVRASVLRPSSAETPLQGVTAT